MRIVVVSGLVLGLLSSAASAEITAEQVAGKTLSFKKNTFQIGADGTLSGTTAKGETVTGTWSVKDGKWCRTIAEPAQLAGKACQEASVSGSNLTILREDGTEIVYKMK